MSKVMYLVGGDGGVWCNDAAETFDGNVAFWPDGGDVISVQVEVM